MISSSHLSKLILFVVLLVIFTLNPAVSEDEPADIWEKKENQNEENNEANDEKDITIESPILSDDINKIVIKTTLILLVFFLGIFLVDKIDFPTPTKPIKQEISNDKLITLK